MGWGVGKYLGDVNSLGWVGSGDFSLRVCFCYVTYLLIHMPLLPLNLASRYIYT